MIKHFFLTFFGFFIIFLEVYVGIFLKFFAILLQSLISASFQLSIILSHKNQAQRGILYQFQWGTTDLCIGQKLSSFEGCIFWLLWDVIVLLRRKKTLWFPGSQLESLDTALWHPRWPSVYNFIQVVFHNIRTINL